MHSFLLNYISFFVTLFYSDTITCVFISQGRCVHAVLKKKEPKPKENFKEKVPGTSAWGWAASAARFRGLMCIALSIALVLSLALAGFFTRRRMSTSWESPEEKGWPSRFPHRWSALRRHFLSLYANTRPAISKISIGRKLSPRPFAAPSTTYWDLPSSIPSSKTTSFRTCRC